MGTAVAAVQVGPVLLLPPLVVDRGKVEVLLMVSFEVIYHLIVVVGRGRSADETFRLRRLHFLACLSASVVVTWLL